MTNFKRLAATTLLTGLTALPLHAQDKEVLTVIVYGGSFGDGWTKSVIEPFEAANPDIDVQIATGLTMQTVAMMRAQRDDATIDVVMMDEAGAAQAKAEGLFEPLDAESIPNLNDLYPRFRSEDDVYTKFMYVSQALTWNKDYIDETPASWEEMWNPDYAGLTVVPDISTSHGNFFLLTANDLAGGNVENVDPGFEKLQSLTPNILTFYTQHAQMAQLFAQGDAAITSWTSDRAQGAIDAGANLGWTIPEEGAYIIDSTIGIAKGTKHLEAAQRYIDYALSVEAQAANAENTYLAPVNSKVELPEAVAAKLPVGEGVLDGLKAVDWDYVTTVRPEWTERWNREVATQ